MQVFTRNTGLLTDQFNYNSGYQDDDGTLYFGSVKGLISFDPEPFTRNNYVPPLYITGFQVNNKEIDLHKPHSLLMQSILYTTRIVLPYNQTSFSIDFAATGFSAPEMTAYAYRMEGLDNDWTYISSNRKVYFTELSPGDYTFRVCTIAREGEPAKEAALQIHITPPFWLSPWAYLFYISMGIAIVLLLVQKYLNRIHEKNRLRIEHLEIEKEKEIYEAKIDFFTNVAHEIRTPLTLIRGPLEEIIDIEHDDPLVKDHLKSIERNTNRLLNLTNQLLDFRQTETKGFHLNLSSVHVNSLLQETHDSFRLLARQRDLHFTLQLPQEPLYAFLDEEAIIKVFSNLYSNAIKYAGKEVKIVLKPVAPADRIFRITFGNDGSLIPAEMKEKVFEPFFRLKQSEKLKGTGIGLALSRSLAERHNGTLQLCTSAFSNIFVLTLPVRYTESC